MKCRFTVFHLCLHCLQKYMYLFTGIQNEKVQLPNRMLAHNVLRVANHHLFALFLSSTLFFSPATKHASFALSYSVKAQLVLNLGRRLYGYLFSGIILNLDQLFRMRFVLFPS